MEVLKVDRNPLKGDFWASHSGRTGGLMVNGMEIQQDRAVDQGEDQAELSDEWKDWLADILG